MMHFHTRKYPQYRRYLVVEVSNDDDDDDQRRKREGRKKF